MTYETLSGRRVVVGVCGSIAAYKACDLVSKLRQSGAEVKVVMTRNATEFVGPASFRALSGQDVACELFGQIAEVEIEHISLAEFGEALIVVGATANVIAKVAAGICDDLLTTTICAAAGRVLLAPAMNRRMWHNPVTQRNVATLSELGYVFVGPVSGHLACGETGSGRLADREDMLDALDQVLGRPESLLRGKRVLITSGPTREWLDPVRFISNPSSGKMGLALAQEALCRGAAVTVVTGPTQQRPPWRAEVVRVETTEEMLEAVSARHLECDLIVAAAAPVDFGPVRRAEQKIKKESSPGIIEVARTPDVIGTVAAVGSGRVYVGFAAETEKLEENALRKLERKGLDLVVANDVSAPGAGFGADTNEVIIYGRREQPVRVGCCSKREIAVAILDAVERIVER